MEERPWQRHDDYNVPTTIRYPRVPAHELINIPAGAFPDTDVKLVDVEQGKNEVPKGEPGEIILKSPLVMQGYWNNPAETAGQLKDGWL